MSNQRQLATAFNNRGMENSRLLLETGANMYSSVNPSGEASPSISIQNIDRYVAIALASALITYFDTGNTPRDRRQIQADFDESMKLSHDEEPLIFRKSSRDLRYSVLVGQQEFGKYVLKANIDSSTPENQTQDANKKLNLGLIAVLNNIDLSHGNGLETHYQEPEIPTADDLIDMADTFEPYKPRKIIPFEVAQQTARMMGIEDVDRNNAELQALWESRGKDPLTLVDLYMSAINEKLNFYGANKYLEHPTVIQDLKDIAERPEGESPRDLTHRQEKDSIAIFASLGYDDIQMRTLFQWEGPFGSLRLRYAAWLASQPFAEPLVHEYKAIANTRKPGEDTLDLGSLFIGLVKHIKYAYREHINPESRRENYDFRLGYQAAAYNTKKVNLEAMYSLAMHILKRQDVTRSARSHRKSK
jgi:hypothetical protein